MKNIIDAINRVHPAVYFLALITFGLVFYVGFLIWLNSTERKALEIAFVPSAPIADEILPETPDYSALTAWAAHPGKSSLANALPANAGNTAEQPVDIFYIHPTTALTNQRWNMAHDDANTAKITERLALKNQASVFAGIGRIYAPFYRQAVFGAFLDPSAQGSEAMLWAYEDVLSAFSHYLDNENDGRPFILVGHGQGAMHGLALLRDALKDKDQKEKLVAAYLLGWPVSVEADLDPLDIEACSTGRETGCVISYQTADNGATPVLPHEFFERFNGVTDQPRKNTKMVCINPLKWAGGYAFANDNDGSLPYDPTSAELLKLLSAGTVGAVCRKDGILELTNTPPSDYQQAVLPGDDYTSVDFNLFWANLRENAVTRTESYFDKKAKAEAKAKAEEAAAIAAFKAKEAAAAETNKSKANQ